MRESEEKKVMAESRLLQNSKNNRNTKNIAGSPPDLFIQTGAEELNDRSNDITSIQTTENNKKS